ncbi:MAG: hypothetical protein JOZ89_04835 [Gammaproteobacteria bacterium]|nr:hypothetical protein [Gammaproteobacteria bacterium]
MTSTTTGPAGWSNIEPARRAGTGHFILTLCRLPGPVSIRPPQSPLLKPFTFFTTRELGPDGKEHFDLHMGYFETLAGAEKWVEGVRGRFPDAIATVAPTAFSRAPDAEVPASHAESRKPAGEDRSLSDTQVLRILGTRGAAGGPDGAGKTDCDQIPLLRPDDTGSRHALKDAVVRGAPVSFAVQLQWSADQIDVGRLPSLPLFKAHMLYATESRREGRSRYFLRLGFFDDPISAKQVAAQLHSHFASAAVVPVSDQEVTRARAATRQGSSIPVLVQQEITRACDAGVAPALPTGTDPVSEPPRQVARDELELELRRLARREMWTNPDLLGETGVRHLKVRVEASRRDLP